METPDLQMRQCSSPLVSELLTMISQFDDDSLRWAAVQTRNPDADGFFIYGVKTTKIYCRPICKARLARRANVSFFFTPDEARNAGFRACKRCKPDAAGLMPEEAAINKIRLFVSEQDDSPEDMSMSLSQMAKITGLSKWHFHRVFKKIIGVTPLEYVYLRKGSSGTPTFLPSQAQYCRDSETVEPSLIDSLQPLKEHAQVYSKINCGTIQSEDKDLALLSFEDLLKMPSDNQWDHTWYSQ